MNGQINLADLNSDQLASLRKQLEAQEKAAVKQREKDKKNYEKHKNKVLAFSAEKALSFANSLKEFKEYLIGASDELREKMTAYGISKELGKGNYEIKSTCGKYKISVSVQSKFEFDERADKAAVLVKEVIREMVKKANLPLYDMLMSLLEKKKDNNQFDPRKVHKLYTHEEKINNEKYSEAMTLFKESYHEVGVKRHIRIYHKPTEESGYENININFSSL